MREKPPLDEALLEHFGVRGMHWGVRKGDYEGASRSTNKEARGDAKEFARAKMFYGEGAGTRRKLIKAKVESKSAKDPTYKKAFDHHLANQDMGKHSEKARSERRRKDTSASVGKNARALNRTINGPFAGAAAIGLATAGAAFVKKNNLDVKAMKAVKPHVDEYMRKAGARKLKRTLGL